MAELGAGSGSGYPAALDTKQTFSDGASPLPDGATRMDSDVLNDILDALIKLETELGTDPSDAADDVGVAPADAATDVADKINMILRRIKEIIGGADWKDAIPSTLTALLASIGTNTTNITSAQAQLDNHSAQHEPGGSDPITFPAVMPRGYLAGLGLSNNGSDATNDIDVAVGACRNVADDEDMVLASIIVKRIDAAWVVGTNQGGMDTGTVANDTWYHVWLIKRTDTSIVDVLFSLSATSPTMPTNYDKKRRIGAVKRGTAANFAFTQVGDEFLWNDPPLDIDVSNPGTAAVLRTLSVPLGLQVWALFNAFTLGSNVNTPIYFSSPDVADKAPSATVGPLASVMGDLISAARSEGLNPFRVRTNTSSQVRSRFSASDATSVLRMASMGWIDRRGRDD